MCAGFCTFFKQEFKVPIIATAIINAAIIYFLLIKNIDGTFYNENDNIQEILSKHIVSPVRFDKAIKLMKDEGIDTFVEIGPGKSLTGFIKKELADVNLINIYDVETLENAIQILKK